jgi:hypothetical protein
MSHDQDRVRAAALGPSWTGTTAVSDRGPGVPVRMDRKFERVDDSTYLPWLNGMRLDAGDRIECLWPDGSLSRHQVQVENRCTYVDHVGTRPSDCWIEKGTKQFASVRIRHRGALISIPLGRDTKAPMCRRVGA